jgi:hypothetical protein
MAMSALLLQSGTKRTVGARPLSATTGPRASNTAVTTLHRIEGWKANGGNRQ